MAADDVSRTRLSAEERRALVVEAATRAFAHGGYAGTSTDSVAKEAGVSQPYVVRIFGTKRELFLEVFARATDRIRQAFAAVVDERERLGGFDAESDDHWTLLGISYAELLRDRDLLMVMMHGFSASGDPEIGAQSRRGMGAIVTELRRTGADDDRIRDFIAQGMLLNVMIAMDALDHLDDPALAPFTHCAFGDALELVQAG